MKVINKILCFFSVFVLCVPVLCFNVAADDTSELTLEEYYMTGGTGDWSGIIRDDIVGSKGDKISVDYPYRILINYNDKYSGYDFTDSFARFKFSIACSYRYLKDFDSREFYYFYRFGRTSDDRPYFQCHISLSPISILNNKFVSDSEIYLIYSIYNDVFTVSSYTIFSNNDSNAYLQCNSSKSSDSTMVLDVNSPCIYDSNILYDTVSEVYSNCITEYNGNTVTERPKSSALKDNIDVKLTPEFGLDMDRVFDQNTGQNDYFKLEVTNNSDTNIQFYCAIVDPGVKTLYNDNGQVSEFAFNHSYWNYIHDSEYYQLDAKTESRYFGFASTTTLYANKLAGNIFWIILKPDEHFEDYIYWENVKIMPTTSYDFLCEVCPTENDIATDMFVTSNEQLEKQFYLSGGSKAHFWSISESLEVDQSVEQYALHSEDVCEIYRVNFSVLSIPEFSSIVRGGNSKITSGWSDTQKQASNPYYKQNLMTGQIEGIENYKEFKGNLSDVDVNLDDVGIDDVKSYISYSQSFFGLLKSVFQCFPALWIIIVFGLTAIVVIAIVRYIRG